MCCTFLVLLLINSTLIIYRLFLLTNLLVNLDAYLFSWLLFKNIQILMFPLKMNH